MENPQVVEIQIAGVAGDPMQIIESAKVTEGGIEGDRYAVGEGSFSGRKREAKRAVTLIASEAIADVIQETGIEVTFADTRRNIMTFGVELNGLVGKQFSIGDVLVEGVELCDPCGRPGALSETADLRGRFKEIFEDKGGLRVKIISGGEIRTGDAIKL